VDVLCITHFHLDHAAATPHFTEETEFDGPILMTHPTKAICKSILKDYLKMAMDGLDELYKVDDLNRCFNKIRPVKYHEEVEVKGMRITAYNAGHVLGAAMFQVEIAGTLSLSLYLSISISLSPLPSPLSPLPSLSLPSLRLPFSVCPTQLTPSISGVTILYTGDFSRHDDRHLCGIEVPPKRPDVLIR
jgi:Cft2 family RNA processing exonuclease